MDQIRWGILGCGKIAHVFAESIAQAKNGVLYAAASQTPGKAADFAEQHAVAQAYTSYDAMVKDSAVDAVYVATTHNFHFEQILLCLHQGKHVLCEKPMTLNAAQTRCLKALAKEKELFLMEGMWTRFLPAVKALKSLLAEGAIGEVFTLQGNLFLGTAFESDHRLANKALAGGALLDMGTYLLHFASILFDDAPERVESSVVMSDTGVDMRSFYLLDFSRGRRAVLSAGFGVCGLNEATIMGSKGHIRIENPHGAQALFLYRSGEDEPECFSFPFVYPHKFVFEVEHAMECIQAGKLESDIMPLSKSIEVLETMDTLRARWGLTYEHEAFEPF